MRRGSSKRASVNGDRPESHPAHIDRQHVVWFWPALIVRRSTRSVE